MNQSILYIIAVVVVLIIGLALYFSTQPLPTAIPAPLAIPAIPAIPAPLTLPEPPAYLALPGPPAPSANTPAPVPGRIPFAIWSAATPSMFTIGGDFIGPQRSITKLHKMGDGTLVTALADGNFYKLSVVGNSGIAKGLTPNTSYYLNYPNAATSPEPIFGDYNSFDGFKDSSSLGNANPIGNHYETKCADSSKSLDNYCIT